MRIKYAQWPQAIAHLDKSFILATNKFIYQSVTGALVVSMAAFRNAVFADKLAYFYTSIH